MNEDRCGCMALPGGPACWVIADGLGGHAGGAAAADLAVAALLRAFERRAAVSPPAMLEYIEAAHSAVRDAQRADACRSGMRTTIVALAASRDYAVWGHVGDSRLYAIRNATVVACTRDHSVAQTLVEANELTRDAARSHPTRNRLLRTLGDPRPVHAVGDISAWPVAEGDAFLLCSDGLWGHLTDEEIVDALAADGDPNDWVRRLDERVAARIAGLGDSADNYSVVAVVRGAA